MKKSTLDKISLYYGMDDPPRLKSVKTRKREENIELSTIEIVNSKLDVKGEKNK